MNLNEAEITRKLWKTNKRFYLNFLNKNERKNQLKIKKKTHLFTGYGQLSIKGRTLLGDNSTTNNHTSGNGIKNMKLTSK